jgi:membrane protein
MWERYLVGLWLTVLGGAVLVLAVAMMTVGQLLGLFAVYVDKSGGYASTYGVLGGVIVLLLWLQLTAYVLVLGAELNGLLERPSEDTAHGSRPSAEAMAARSAASDGQRQPLVRTIER